MSVTDRCTECRGKGEIIVDESHNDTCEKCGGNGLANGNIKV